ncbi:ATP-binding protein [Pseudomonadota bacterium]
MDGIDHRPKIEETANNPFVAKAQSAISTKLFLALGFITVTAIVAGAASILALNRFQLNFESLISNELPVMSDTANISQLSVSVADRGASLIISPNTWTRLNIIGQVEDDAQWLEEILNNIPDEDLPGNRKADLLRLKGELVNSYSTLNTQTENRIIYAERLHDINVEMAQLQQDLVSVQFATNLPDGAFVPSGTLHQWNESIHAIIFRLMAASRSTHAAPLKRLEQRVISEINDVRTQTTFLPAEAKLDAEDILSRLDEITKGNDSLFAIKRADLQTKDQVEATLGNARTISEHFMASSELATSDIRRAITVSNQETSRSMNITLQAMVGFILVSALVAVATFLYVSRTVLKRLEKLRHSMLTHAEGKDEKIDTSGDDEITEMAQSLKYLVDTLHMREAGLLNAKEEAETASVAKTRFLAAASHDLRQPLQAISLFIYALEGKEDNGEKREIIHLIRNSVDSLKELLNTLLDISKLEAGVMQPAMKSFTAGPMIERIKSELTAVAWANDLELRTVTSNVHVYSDPSLLGTIIRNLVDNAIKYTEEGRVLVGCRRRPSWLRIEVWDTGPGIAQDQREMIFQDFYQIDNDARKRTQGLGLGLSIVRRMSDLLSCRMGCDSTPGRGSVFWVEVPVSDSLRPYTQHQHLQALPVQGNGNGRQIIIVEDDEQVLSGLVALLESHGYSTLGLHTPQRDLVESTLAQHAADPAMVIADYRLETSLTGRDAVELIREVLGQEIPAIIITGDTAPERLREAKQSGLPILHKPVQPEELLANMHAILNKG